MDPDIQGLERAVQADPHNLDDARALARAYLRQGRMAEAYHLLNDGAFERSDPLLLEIGEALAESEEALLRRAITPYSIQVASHREDGRWAFENPEGFLEAGIASGRRRPVLAVDLCSEVDSPSCREFMAILDRFTALIHIEISDDEIGDRALACLPDLPALRRFEMSLRGAITGGGLAFLAGLSGLRRLELSDVELGQAGLQHLRGLTELRVLVLRDGALTDAGLASLAGLTELEELDLAANELTDRGLASLVGLRRLERLVLRYNPEIAGAGLASLASLPRLARLDLEGLSLEEEHLASLSQLSALRELDLSGCGGINARSLGFLEPLQGLEKLTLRGAELDAEALAVLARLPALASLDLGEAWGLTEAGLAALASASSLRELALSSCFSSLTRFVTLERLAIQHAELSDENIGLLAGVPSLRHINLEFCEGFTEAGLARLAALPRLQQVVVDSDICNKGRLRALLNKPRSPEEAAALIEESQSLAARAKDAEALERRAAIELELGRPGRAYQLLVDGGAPPEEGSTLMRLAEELVAGEEELLERWDLTEVELAFVRDGDSWAWFPAEAYLLESISRGSSVPVSAVRFAEGSAQKPELRAVIDGLGALRAVRHLELPTVDEQVLKALPPNLQSLDISGVGALSEAVRAALASLDQLRALKARGRGVDDAFLARLAPLIELEHLDLSEAELSEVGLAALPRAHPKLAVLVLDGNRRRCDAGLSALSGLPALRRLSLRACPDLGAALGQLSSLGSLEHLKLDDVELAERGLSPLASLTALRSLSLAACRGLRDEHLAALAPLSELRALNLAASGLRGRGLANLRATRLASLDLSGCAALDQAGLLALTELSDLERLSLAGASLRGLDLAVLAALPRLVELDLSGSGIDDRGLAGLAGAAALRRLDISRCDGLSQEGVAALAAAPRLEAVEVEGLGISPGQLRALLKAPISLEDRRGLEAELAALGERVETARSLMRRAEIELELGRPGRAYRARVDHGALGRDEEDFWALAAELAAEERDLVASLTGEELRLAGRRYDEVWSWGPGKLFRDEIVRFGSDRLLPARAVDLGDPARDPDSRRVLDRLTELQALEHLQARRGALELGDWKALCAHPTLRSLDLSGGAAGAEELKVLGARDDLIALSLLHDGLGDADLDRLGVFRRLRSLTLRPGSAEPGLRGAGLGGLGALGGLTSLVIEAAPIDDGSLAILSALTGLEDLSLAGCAGVSDLGLRALAPLIRLRSLDLSAASLSGAVFEGFDGLESLQTLKLNGCGALAGEALLGLAGLPRLEVLELRGSAGLEAAGLRALSRCRGLETLDLSGSVLDRRGLEPLGELPRLGTLNLSGTPVDDRSLEALSSCQCYELVLGGCPNITEAGVAHLAGIDVLSRVDLRGTAITRERALELLPEVAFVNDEPR